MFVSKKLNDAYHKSKESFEDFEQDVIHVSQDIRFLELLLKNYAPKGPFYSLFSHECKIRPRQSRGGNEKVEIEYHLYEFVAWDINEREKKSSFRIFYKKFEAWLLPCPDNASQDSPVDARSRCTIPKDSKLLENRPLVETSVSTRLKIYPYLPTFLEELAEELSKNKTQLNFEKFKHSIHAFEKIIKKEK